MSSKTKGSTKAPVPKFRGTRRLIRPIDTNLGSYDSKDPFLALNVLLKLLTSLQSRIGGCYLKLTPEEHKLSLHLINIVDPFVGFQPSHRTLITRQPTEILDAIVFHVDSKQDLLSLALSCQRMHTIVIPRHFDYRVIRCKVSSISVWNHLIVHRSLAKNVRRLEILDERSRSASSSGTADTELEMVPAGIMASDTDLESTDDELAIHEKQERYLVSALARMTSLSAFSWSCNHSPICIDNIWPTLLKCHTLRQVEINDNLVFSSSYEGEEEISRSENKRQTIVCSSKSSGIPPSRLTRCNSCLSLKQCPFAQQGTHMVRRKIPL